MVGCRQERPYAGVAKLQINDIDLELFITPISFDLKIGVTLETFHKEGNLQHLKAVLSRTCTHLAKIVAQSLIRKVSYRLLP